MDKIKRTWYYIQKPAEHEISCTKCKGRNLEWSEFAGHVWCYDCQIDFADYISALSGPVPTQIAGMLGICFDRYNMFTDDVEYYDFNKNEYVRMSVEEYKQLNKKPTTMKVDLDDEKTMIAKEKKAKKSEIIKVEAEEVTEQSIVIVDTINQELEKRNITEEALQMMEEEFPKLIINDVNDKTGYKEVTDAQTMCRNTRLLTVKVCKDGRAELIRLQKENIKKENSIVDRVVVVEEILAAKRKLIDDEKDRIKNEKDTLEQSRLQERAVKLIEYGMNFTGDAYVLDDIKISVLQVKTADEFVFTTLFAAVETRYKAIQEAKRYEEEQREIAAANAKRILEEQLAQAEVLKQREAALEARQKAIEDAELAAKKAAEERIRLAQEEQEKKQREIIEAELKAREELLKSRMSSLFALGFSQQGNILAFKELQVNLNTLAEHTEEGFKHDLISITNSVQVVKTRIEQERLAEIEKIKADTVAMERKYQEEAEEADRITAEEIKQIKLQAEAAKPDLEKFNAFCKAISDIPLPEFSTSVYQAFAEVIKADRLLILKNLYGKKPV